MSGVRAPQRLTTPKKISAAKARKRLMDRERSEGLALGRRYEREDMFRPATVVTLAPLKWLDSILPLV